MAPSIPQGVGEPRRRSANFDGRLMHIFCDFDGTITRCDTTDYVLSRLARPEWEEVEAEWTAGRITAATCMRRQVGMIQGSDAELNAVLDSVELDPGFLAFVAWCEAEDIPITIVSDGVRQFIDRVLARHGLQHLPVVANQLAGAAGRRRLDQPWMREGCAAGSGVCKCAVAAQETPKGRTTMVFIGDGRSDFCVSGRADILFAKSKLADYAASRGKLFVPFDTFHDVTLALADLAKDRPVRAVRAKAI
jgi:2-hydroxy-3-keto-5-methylthiopentenyl-1-phosphate phosphatase